MTKKLEFKTMNDKRGNDTYNELKEKCIRGNAKREKLYEELSARLDTAFMVVELREKYNLSQR